MTNTVFFPGLGLEFELNRVAFSVFGHNIYWYGIIIATGFLLAVAYGLWRAPRFSMDPDVITDAIFVVVPSAIIGARAYYVIFNPAVCFTADGSFSLLNAVAFWDGGLAIYGGVIGTVISAVIFCKVRKVDFWSGMDITAYGLLIGQMVGRWGNFVNVECYGGVTTMPWRMCSESIANDLLRDGLLESRQMYDSILDGALGVHPAFFYESMWNLLGFILLVLLAKRGRKFNGQMFLSYVIWYGLGRAVIEGMRTDSLYFFGTGIRSSQMLGIVSALVGIGLFVLRLKTAGPASPPFVKVSNEEVPQPEESAPAAEILPEGEEAAPAAEPAMPEPEESVPVAASAEPAALEEEQKEEKQDGGDAD
ncbi:MAG: prolipoprotein diacylglyceryl transferase [Oscillospiraceae bacterium]|nr:prolipoprotein diacylglyceryl transferase [Oscillospiraceae bacterium]